MSREKLYGTGSIFRQAGRTNWMIQYWYDGKRFVESARSADEAVARRLLRQRLKDAARGRAVGTVTRRASFDDLVELLRADYRRKQNKSLDRATRCVRQLRRFFGHVRAHQIDYALAEKFVNARLDEGAAHATVKQERAILGRMLKLAVRVKLLDARPELPVMGESRNARQGFFEDGEFRAVLDHLPEDLQPVMEFMYLTGWRRSEAIGLQWRQVDLAAGEVRLESGETKNNEPRVFPLKALPVLGALLRERRERTSETERERGCIVSHVFHRGGKPIRSYHDSWRRACAEAGFPGKLVHDFRRTAVRRLERAGVPRSQAMKLVGHKTEDIYRRYAIVSQADLVEAVAKVAVQVEADRREPRRVVPLAEPLTDETASKPLAQAASSGLARAAARATD